MKLPNADAIDISEAKIVDYLLSLSHPDGRGKAIFFRHLGFSPERWDELAKVLRQHGQANSVVTSQDTAFGVRYVIEGVIQAPSGKTPHIRSVWFVDRDSSFPRLVTAYPIETKDER